MVPLFADLDVIVFDIQDLGTSFYAYISTMAYVMVAAARVGKPFFVLDRSNSISGDRVEGTMLDGNRLVSWPISDCATPWNDGWRIGNNE
jgi:uncharacterized protein YbbC (DUF1343 family)